jgi:hypothetical protein
MTTENTSGNPQRLINGRWAPGMSGNPKGAPAGRSRRAQFTQAISEHLEDVINAVLSAAKQGDIQAARLILERVVPVARGETPPVQIPGLADAKGLTEKAEAVLKVCAAGEISVDVADRLLVAIGSLSRIIEVEDLARRISALENKEEIA